MEQSSRTSTTVVGKKPTVVGEDRTVVAERLGAFLRRRHPEKTAENVAAETGISAPTVARWLDRGSAPSAKALLILIGVYGASVTCAVMDNPPGWLVDRARAEEDQAIRDEIATLEARLSGRS